MAQAHQDVRVVFDDNKGHAQFPIGMFDALNDFFNQDRVDPGQWLVQQNQLGVRH